MIHIKKFEKNYRISPKELEESDNKVKVPSVNRDNLYLQ